MTHHSSFIRALISFSLIGLALVAQADVQPVKSSRLEMTEARLERIRELEKTDPLMADLLKTVRKVAEENLKLPPPAYSDLQGGSSLNHVRAYSGRIGTSAFMYRLDGDKRYLDNARRDLLAVCSFPDWHPGHFLDVAEMAMGVSYGYAWLGEALGEDRAVLREALVEKFLQMAPRAYDPKGRGGLNWQAFGTGDKSTNNWNFVCNGSFVTTALVLRGEQPELCDIVIAGARGSLPLALVGYAPDGAWPEGPTYWSYGTSFLVRALSEMQDNLGTDYGLSESPGLDKTLIYALQIYGSSDIAFNFGDGGPARSYDSPIPALVWLAERFDMPEVLPELRRRLRMKVDAKPSGYALSLPPGGLARGLISCAMAFPEVNDDAASSKPPLASHFRGDSDFVVLRSSGSEGMWLGLKGGTNGLSHGHLDLGSFVLDTQGVRWAVDLGSENYRLPDFWDYLNGGRRWTYYRMNNRSHNTITLGDALQDADATAPVTAFSPANAAGESSAVVDLTPAYPGLARKLLRSASMGAGNAGLLLKDDIEGLAENTPVAWRMLTAAAVSLSEDGRTARLTSRDKILRVELQSPAAPDVRFSLGSARPPSAVEHQNRGISVLEVTFTPETSDVSLAVHFTAGAGPAAAVSVAEPSIAAKPASTSIQK